MYVIRLLGSILISSFSRESVINIAFECRVIRRMNKFAPWLLITALMDCLANQDHASCLNSIHEKYCPMAEKHGMTERKISWEFFSWSSLQENNWSIPRSLKTIQNKNQINTIYMFEVHLMNKKLYIIIFYIFVRRIL